MTASTQYGAHPEVEQLSAFAERTLPEQERNQVLGHLAVCSRCRQIIALAGHAEEEAESHALVAAAAVAPVAVARRSPNPWWKNWRLVWIPAGVVAACTATSLSIYLHRTEQGGITVEIARQANPSAGLPGGSPAAEQENAIQPSLSQIETPPPAPAPLPPPKAQPHLPPSEASAAPPELKAASAGAAASPLSFSSEQQSAPLPPPALSTNETVSVAADRSGPETVSAQQFIAIQPPAASTHAGLRATPPPPAAAPVSPQLQDEREKKFADFDRQVESAESSDHLSAARANPQDASVGAAVAGAAKSTAAYTQPAASQLGSIAAFGAVHGLSSNAGLAGMAIHLPSGLALASIASSGHLVLAVDKSGALFLTQDSGASWRQVAPQWSGRAVLVRTRSLLTPRALTAPAAESDKEPSIESPAPPAQSIVFEVVNEKNQVWQSIDGLVWIAK
jgi:Putative zinc-finger